MCLNAQRSWKHLLFTQLCNWVLSKETLHLKRRIYGTALFFLPCYRDPCRGQGLSQAAYILAIALIKPGRAETFRPFIPNDVYLGLYQSVSPFTFKCYV